MSNLKPDSFINDNIKDLVIERQVPWEDTIKTKVINALTGFNLDDVITFKRGM